MRRKLWREFVIGWGWCSYWPAEETATTPVGWSRDDPDVDMGLWMVRGALSDE